VVAPRSRTAPTRARKSERGVELPALDLDWRIVCNALHARRDTSEGGSVVEGQAGQEERRLMKRFSTSPDSL
jgi:hypothetical protein